MSVHVFQCDNKTFLIAVHTTWDVQTLYVKNREGKRELSKSEFRESEWPNTLIQRLDLQDPETAYTPGKFGVSCANLVGFRKEGQKHYSMGLCGLISML